MIKKIVTAIKDKVKGIPGKRSPKWQTVRKKFLEKNAVCELCGGKEKLEVHHVVPFHINPELELEESNLITLCESGKNGIICHRAIAHLGSYFSYNENVREDIKIWKEKIQNRP